MKANTNAGTPIQAGSAWIQTAPFGNANTNPTPVFANAEALNVTPNMKSGSLVQRLHSWAGLFLWGNSSQQYVFGGSGNVQSLTQNPLIADPLCVKFTTSTESGMSGSNGTPGFFPGLSFGTPVGTLGMWFPVDYSSLPGGSSQTASLTPMGGIVSLLQVIPAGSGSDSEPAWNPETNVLVDRMGDWDVTFQATNPTDISEQLVVTMAQGSPFAWISHSGMHPDRGVQCIVPATAPFGSRTAYVQPVATGVDNLGCYLVGALDPGFPTLGWGTPEIPLGNALTLYRFMAVFYDTTTTTVAESSATGASGVFLSSSGTGISDISFVIAALPQVEYPGTDSSDPFLPTQTQAITEAEAWAAALAPYAFNFLTDTAIHYGVSPSEGTVKTTFTATVTAAGPIGTSASGQTVMCLQRHQYGDFDNGLGLGSVFAGGSSALQAVALAPSAAGPFVNQVPAMFNGHYPYWTVKGRLQPIAAGSFSTVYSCATLLPFMPPPPSDTQPDAPPGSKTTNYFYNAVNGMMAWDWQKAIANFPPASTQLQGGPQQGLYNSANQLRTLGANLALAKVVTDITAQSGQTIIDPVPGAVAPNPPVWPSSTPTQYDEDNPLYFYLEGIQDFIRLSTAETPTILWGNGGSNQPAADSASYFLYEPTLGAILYYPTNVALPAGGLAVAEPTSYIGEPEDAFNLNTYWDDYHYNYGWLLAACVEAALMAPWGSPGETKPYDYPDQRSFFLREAYGTLVDQLIMSLAYDPAVPDWWTVDGCNYSKLNFFDQWSGQGWTDGFNPTPYTLGKQENSFGEAYQAWASIYLWGQATGRPGLANLGMYLATTALYNYQAYWSDNQQSRVPAQTFGSSNWAATGDWVPTAVTGSGGGYDWGAAGASYFSSWWFWGATPGTSGPPSTAWAVKLQQAQVFDESEFGGAEPIATLYNHWLAQSAFSLDFGREPQYQRLIVSLLNLLPSSGWNWQPYPQDGEAYVATINQMAAVVGLRKNYADPRPGNLTGVTPWQWMWSLSSQGLLSEWNNLQSEYIQSVQQSVAELMSYFWVLDHYGPPSFDVFGYSGYTVKKKIDIAPLQPITAAFIQGSTLTLVAFNPNSAEIPVNWWRRGEDAITATPLLPKPVIVPAHWFAVTTIEHRI